MPGTSPDPSPATGSTEPTRTASTERPRQARATCHIGVSSPPHSEETKAVRALGHELVCIRDENFTAWIEDATVRVSPAADVVVDRLLVTKRSEKLEDLQAAALDANTTPVVNRPWAVATTHHTFRAGGSVDRSRVCDHEPTFDDSLPDGAPTATGGEASSVLGYTTHVRLAGRAGAASAVATSDTGAKRTCIHTELAGRIGAGPIVGPTHGRSGTGSTAETRPLLDGRVRIDEQWHGVTASVTDRSDLTSPVLLGRDVLEAATLDISKTVEE